jgi:hypothetical protein
MTDFILYVSLFAAAVIGAVPVFHFLGLCYWWWQVKYKKQNKRWFRR